MPKPIKTSIKKKANRNTVLTEKFLLSNLYWSTNGLQYNNTTLYGNILDLITSDASGAIQEYVNVQPLCSGQPLASCLYMGLGSLFIPINNYYDARRILQLDQLPANSQTLVGYLYAGLLSLNQTIFAPPSSPSSGPSYATNQVYAIYINPGEESTLHWKDVTNLFPA